MSLPPDFHSLHPESQAFLKYLSEESASRQEEITPELAREAALATTLESDGRLDFEYQGERREYIVPSPHDSAGIPVWVYIPSTVAPHPAIFVYFHGGGFTVGNRVTHDTCCKMVATESKCVMVNVDYRLAPEHKLPAPMDDGIAAVRWAMDNKALIGGSPSSKVGIGGDSAGGRIASSVAHDVTGLAFQILVYTCVDATYPFPSSQLFAEGYGLTMASMLWYAKQFTKDESDRSDPRLSTIKRPRFGHLPPTLFVVASHDPIRDDSAAYASKLSEAGVKNETLYLEGVVHTFFRLPGFFKENCQKAYKKVAQFIQENAQ
ncbi:uncharacterized protein LOC106152908 [Lingula anatina]|uniref:Uncharacterized protein LOC106152908 n=1 Tax=Lingula anatina TaxID=7574 RepID=A0A1S3H7X9_LINAN|nr:uncharacterized protein LOC106152908 [Lingula anatina]|eukprot:XP_013382103.1 uncharacterized protein LOC106152908 [Lingula anatina]